MNPVKLIFKHGGEMLVSPIGLRFVPDPEHGTLVLIPDVKGPKGYQLDMTLEEAKQAYREAASMQPLSNFAAVKIEEIEKAVAALRELRPEAPLAQAAAENGHVLGQLSQLGGLLDQLEAKASMHGDHLDNLSETVIKQGERIGKDREDATARWVALFRVLGLEMTNVDGVARLSWKPDAHLADARIRELGDHLGDLSVVVSNQGERIGVLRRLQNDRWLALQLHLGLPLGWENLHEGASEVKGALVSQAEEIDALKKEAKESWDLRSKITAELRDLIMERVERVEQGMIDRVGGLERLTGCLSTYGIYRSKVDRLEKRVDWLTEHYPPSRPEAPPKTVTIDPITIAWSAAGPVNMHTGQPIECSFWKAPEDPKKSAWKSVGFAPAPPVGDYLARAIGESRIEHAWSTGRVLVFAHHRGIAIPSNYEFCPIPE
jgi:hypothetical protein